MTGVASPDRWGTFSTPRLSYATSLAALRLGEMREHPVAERYTVHWTQAETDDLVGRLLSAAKEAAGRTADNAVAARRQADAGSGAVERTVRLVHHVLLRRQFRSGPSSNYPYAQARDDLLETVARGAPVQIVLLNFPAKFCQSGLKAAGPLPDLAELAALVRIAELVETLRAVYPPGAFVTLITDGEHFRPHPDLPLDDGVRTLRHYVDAVCADCCVVEDYDSLAVRRVGEAIRAAHVQRRDELRQAYVEAFTGLDIGADPLGVLRRTRLLDPCGNFTELFTSLLFSVDIPGPPTSRSRSAWARELYTDPYDVGPWVAAELRSGRREVLRRTWQDTIDYVAAWHADREQGYRRQLVPGCNVLASVRPSPGRLGLGLLGGPAVPPWHATGVVDERGIISCDFLVSLRDQGFVPAYSPMVGSGQPFAMVPVTGLQLAESRPGLEVMPELWSSIALRRR